MNPLPSMNRLVMPHAGRSAVAGGRLASIISSTTFLGLALAVVTWSITFREPDQGLDLSWVSALYMATHHGLDFGNQIIFTWGPLGFLRQPYLFYGDLGVLAFLYSSLLYCAFCVSLVWALRRVVSVWVALPLAFALLVVLPVVNEALVLAAIWCLALLAPQPPRYARWIVVYGLAAFGATECLVRLSPGPAILVMGAISLLTLSTRWRDLAAFVTTALVTFWTLWFAAGQGLANVPDYVRGSLEVLTGYSQAMGVEPAHGWWTGAAILMGVALTAAAFSGGRRRRRLAGGAVVAVATFTVFKEGVVRFDSGHAPVLFATLAALTLIVPWRRLLQPLAALLLVASVWIGLSGEPPEVDPTVNPIDHVQTFASQIRDLVSPGRRAATAEADRSRMIASYGLDPTTLRLLRDQSTEIEPWEAGVAWAYRLDWDPLPAFQNYVAYTPYLDRRNTEALLAADGPTRVLRQNVGPLDAQLAPSSVDSRFAGWDPPRQQVALLCDFVPLHTTRRWQVLAPSHDRCGAPRLLESVETEYGQVVDVPRPKGDMVVLVKIHGAGVTGLERIAAALVRAKPRFLLVNGIFGYRLVPGTAADGLILRVPRRDDFPGPAFRMSPDAETLRPNHASGKLTIDFYAMPIRRLGAPRPLTGGG